MEKLYDKDVYLKETYAEIVSIQPANKKTGDAYVTLDRTIFFPEGGGQSSDIGKIDDFDVVDVQEKGSEILHLVKDAFGKLEVGNRVKLTLDWNHRFDNMQRHLGEHILSGTIYSLFGASNRGFHMGDEYMTIDIAFSQNSPYDRVTDEMAKSAELKANEVIWHDLPVSVSHFDKKEDAEFMPVRKSLKFDENISIVTVGDMDHPADCVACCGTHPSSTGQVGIIKIYKIEPNKGMSRIYFDAGRRAFLHCQESYENLRLVENDLSAGLDDFTKKYEIKKEKDNKRQEKLSATTKLLVSQETEKLKEALKDPKKSRLLIQEYELLSADDLTAIGRSLSKYVSGFLFLIHLPSKTLMLFSNEKECGKIIKDRAKDFNGRGGGGKNFARAVFDSRHDIKDFITYINEEL